MGDLAKNVKQIPSVSAEWINFLLGSLAHFPRSRTSKALGLSIYGVGQLVLTRKLQGKMNHQLDKGVINALLKLSSLDSQALSNSLTALGYLTRAGQLEGTITSQAYQHWLQRLLGLRDLSSQELSTSLTGLRLFGSSRTVRGGHHESSLSILATAPFGLA